MKWSTKKLPMKQWLVLCTVMSSFTVCSLAVAQGNAGHSGHNYKNRMQDHFARIDTNGDSFITKEEQMAFSAKSFAETDKDNDGKVTLKEIEMQHMQRKGDKKSTP